MPQFPNQFDPEQLKRLANSPEGQKLLSLLQSSAPETVESALSAAEAGDLSGARNMLKALLRDPQAKTLAENMMRQLHG